MTRDTARALALAITHFMDDVDTAVVRNRATTDPEAYAIALFERAPAGSSLIAGNYITEFTTIKQARDYLRASIAHEVVRNI